MLTTDYGDVRDFDNRWREQTFRSVLSRDLNRSGFKAGMRSGYIHTAIAYDY